MTRGRYGFLLAILISLAGASALACSNSHDSPPVVRATPDPGSEPRSFAMGLSSLPAELTEESYEEAFALAAQTGEVVLIQRTPPWEEMLTGRLSDETAATTEREVALAKRYGLDIFLAVDPIEAGLDRAQLADLPDDLEGKGFGDEEIQKAFLAYIRYVAENYKPTYLAIGVEVNSYQHENAQDFEQFVLLYHAAYQLARELLPETLIFPTFQLEEMKGLLPRGDPYPPQWYLINRFEPRLDMLVVSSYPSLVYDDLNLMPESYYVELRAYTNRPISIAGMGYSSVSVLEGPVGNSEEDQALFLQRALDNAQQLEMPLAIWFVGRDVSFTGDASFDQLASVGLQHQDGSQKHSWRIWQETARRLLVTSQVASETPGP
jgi:hypothetical protein